VRSAGTFDYVIVGAGTAGCVLANRLSADPDVRVLLLEAGGKDNWMWIHIPVGYLYCIGNPRTDWCFRTEPDPGLNGRSILYARGRVLGGCSSINAMLYLRGQAADYDAWAAHTGDHGWAWDNVLPIFKASENHHAGANAVHGDRGEWRVEKQRLSWEILNAWRDAAAQAGIMPTADYNGGDNAGAGFFEVNQRRGVRWNTSKAFLRPIQHRPNLEVRTLAQVKRLCVNNQRITGVEFWQNNQLFFAASRIETVLAAGAIGSPHLLQCSGIGPGDLLQQHGVPVVHDNPHVGEHLQDHLQLRMAFRVRGVRTLNERSHSLWHKMQMALEYALFRTGPLTMAPSQLGAFARSDPSQARANVEFHVQPLSLDRFGEPLHRFPALTASVCNLRPTARGYVRLASADARDAPRIHPRYLSTTADQQVAIDALRLARRIASQPALAAYRPEEFLPGPSAQSDAQLAAAAGDIGTTIFHPVGTCRMGPANTAAVVDSRLRAHGLLGLRIVDASIMPTITSGNTNSPTLMIAERGAQMMREDRLRT